MKKSCIKIKLPLPAWCNVLPDDTPGGPRHQRYRYIVDNVRYADYHAATTALQITAATLYLRCNSDKFPNYRKVAVKPVY